MLSRKKRRELNSVIAFSLWNVEYGVGCGLYLVCGVRNLSGRYRGF
jgi:hypothetical protein